MTVIYHPGTPGSPGTPDQLIDVDLIGWSSGAVSIPTITGDGGYEFKVPADAVGVVCGLAGSFVGTGYRTIAHALYFTRGSVVLMEYGEQVDDLGGYLTGDKFVLWREGGNVAIFRNGVLESVRPQLVHSTFRLASSLYMNGDTIVDAKVASMAASFGSLSATVGPLSALSMEGAGSFMAGSFGPLAADVGAGNYAMLTGSMGSLGSRMSQGMRCELAATMPSLTSYAEGGLMAPAWATSETAMRSLTAASWGFTGEVARLDGGFGGMAALASDRPYGEMRSRMGGGFFAFIGEFVDVNVLVSNLPGGYKLHAVASSVDATVVDADLPALTLEAVCGAQLEARLPAVTLDAEATITQVATLDVRLPMLTLEAKASVGGSARVDGVLAALTLEAVCGAQAVVALPGGYELDAQAVMGGTAVLDVVLPALTLDAMAIRINHAELDAQLPAVVAIQGVVLDAELPMLRLYAVAGGDAPASYESYAVNLATGAVTRYTNYPFDNIVRFGNKFFGIRADGIFELTGETDDGANIDATLTTFMTKFGADNLKRVKWLYLFGRMGEGVNVTFKPDEGLGYTYPSVGVDDGTIRMHRARPGGKIRGTYYEFTIQNVNGSKFHIDRVEAIVDTTTRAM